MKVYRAKTVLDDLKRNNIDYNIVMTFDSKFEVVLCLGKKTQSRYYRYIYFRKEEDFIWFCMKYDVKGTQIEGI